LCRSQQRVPLTLHGLDLLEKQFEPIELTVDLRFEMVRRLSDRVGTQWSAERTRPDGRVIEVRSNPVPGGGVVLIYSDVTEPVSYSAASG